jgi:hypothetical protein
MVSGMVSSSSARAEGKALWVENGLIVQSYCHPEGPKAVSKGDWLKAHGSSAYCKCNGQFELSRAEGKALWVENGLIVQSYCRPEGPKAVSKGDWLKAQGSSLR